MQFLFTVMCFITVPTLFILNKLVQFCDTFPDPFSPKLLVAPCTNTSDTELYGKYLIIFYFAN